MKRGDEREREGMSVIRTHKIIRMRLNQTHRYTCMKTELHADLASSPLGYLRQIYTRHLLLPVLTRDAWVVCTRQQHNRSVGQCNSIPVDSRVMLSDAHQYSTKGGFGTEIAPARIYDEISALQASNFLCFFLRPQLLLPHSDW